MTVSTRVLVFDVTAVEICRFYAEGRYRKRGEPWIYEYRSRSGISARKCVRS